MSLNNIKKMKKDNGFTIVELLIVIVVIAILAAIIIVAYQGVTSRANTSKAQTNAVSVQKKAEAYNADNTASGGNGYYPTTAAAFTAVTSGSLGALPAGVTLQGSAATALSGTTGATNILYVACNLTSTTNATGYWVGYWNFSNSNIVYITGGSVVAPAASTTVPTCPSGTTAATT
jgi:type IV pilus assembly protein PilA